jgi:HupE / UreJ protein
MKRNSRAFLSSIAILALLATTGSSAHEIPNEVTIQTFLKPEGHRLTLLVRAPLKAMRDTRVPERDDGFIDLERIDPVLRTSALTWVSPLVKLYENDRLLAEPHLVAVRASLPADRSFDSYDQALNHTVNGAPLPPDTELYWEAGLIDVAFVYTIDSDQSNFSIESGLTRLGLRTNVVMRFLPPGGAERAFDIHGDPEIVRLDPRWHQAAFLFVKDGFFHILDGVDHLLFLLCLVIPFRNFRSLLLVVTSFTVAHSITLIASAFDMAPSALWFPPLIETLIAASIVYMGLENIVSPKLERRWLITFGFGLVHGFGFSFALRERLQFAGEHLLTSLLAFNVGVEIGQVLVLIVALPLLGVLFRYVVAERVGTIIMSVLIVHTAWHWLTERFDRLRQYQFQMPAFDMFFMVGLLRWLMLLVIVAAFAWLVFGVFKPGRRPEIAEAAEKRT